MTGARLHRESFRPRTPMHQKPLVLVLALSLCACSSTSDYELRFRGSKTLNPNSKQEPNSVPIRVLPLRGADEAKRHETEQFDALWEAAKQAIDDKKGMSLSLLPDSSQIVQLLQMPPEVTHVAVLALFNQGNAGEERVVLSTDRVEAVEIVLDGFKITAVDPDAAPAADPAPKQEP